MEFCCFDLDKTTSIRLQCLNAASTVSSTVSVLLVLSTLLSSGSAQSDQDIFNFALQLECLEAEFYNYAAGNGGLPASDRGGGPVPIGGRAASLSSGALVRPSAALLACR